MAKMDDKPPVNEKRNITFSLKDPRPRRSLSERMRELGIHLRKEKKSYWATSQIIDLKFDYNKTYNYAVMTPNLNLEQITYFQPEVALDEDEVGRNLYKITKFDTKLKGPKETLRISDIEVKSYKPKSSMIFRKKKRHASFSNRIEEILNKNKPQAVYKDPSEESIFIRPKTIEKEKTISDLSESILQNIFSYFTQQERNSVLSRVCKSWYYILKDPVFWNEVDFFGNKIPKDTIIQIIRRYPTMKKLLLINVVNVEEILLELSRCNNSITHLGVKHCVIGSEDFARIITHVVSCCINLEVLDIKGMSFQCDSFFLELGRLKNFRSINLSGNKLLNTLNLTTISINCKNLQELRIMDICLNGDQVSLKDEDLTFITFHLQENLRTLKLDMQQLTNVSYQAILKCVNLTCLAMKNCIHLRSDIFAKLPVLKNLKKLKITRAINLNPEDFQFVFFNENLYKIEQLDLNGCWNVGETGLQTITKKLKSLKSLSLQNCKSIKGSCLPHLYDRPELTHLNLAHTDVKGNHILSLCRKLRALETLVVDPKVIEKPMIAQLRKFSPNLKIIVSFSEFQKNEKLLKI